MPVALAQDDDGGGGAVALEGLGQVIEAPCDPLACDLAREGTLEVGGLSLATAGLEHFHEHEGQHSMSQLALLVDPADGRVVAAWIQRTESVFDAGSELWSLEQAVADLDGDGVSELCLEQVVELGSGLFSHMALGDLGLRWVPAERDLVRMAWRLDASARRFVRAPVLDGACPLDGYAPLVNAPAEVE